jgi:hypothetical protein
VSGVHSYLDGCKFLLGANYPWIRRDDGRSNYGLDFGANIWGTHEGVTTHDNIVQRDFAEMASLGVRVVRWFVFCDGRGGITFDSAGLPAGLANNFFADMDAALAIAEHQNIKMNFVLLDHYWVFHHVEEGPTRSRALMGHADVLKDEKGREALLGNVFAPLFQRYGDSKQILAWEVMNEPDFVIRELDWNRKKVKHPISLSDFKTFVRSVADAVHHRTSSKVTVGGGRVKYLHLWDDDSLGLDFLQVHPYNEFMNTQRDEKLYGRRFSDLGLKRPLIIGEFSSKAKHLRDAKSSPASLSDREYLDYALHGGYAGAWFWSYSGTDRLGSPDLVSVRDWAKSHVHEIGFWPVA